MPDTLQTVDQLIALSPDNTSRLITPAIFREVIVSAFGFLASFDPTSDDDNVNSAGHGFFDAGSQWFNTLTRGQWGCFDGSPHTAIWRRIGPTVPMAGSNITITSDVFGNYVISGAGGAAAPLTLQPPLDADFALALKQHSPTQSGNLLQIEDSTGTLFGPSVSPVGDLSNSGRLGATGTNNERFGMRALPSLTTGTDNVSVGADTLSALTSGDGNIALGRFAGQGLTFGSQNIALGFSALAGGNNDQVVSLGENSGLNANGANGSVFIGAAAGYGVTSQTECIAIGFQALGLGTPTGAQCTAVGYQAGGANPGAGCTYIGALTSGGSSPRTNSTALGAGATLTADHQVMLGTAAETVVFPGRTSGLVAMDLPSLDAIAAASGDLSASNVGSGYPYSNLSGAPAAPVGGHGQFSGNSSPTMTPIMTATASNGTTGMLSIHNTGSTAILVQWDATDYKGATASGSANCNPGTTLRIRFDDPGTLSLSGSFLLPYVSNIVSIQEVMGTPSTFDCAYGWTGFP